MHSQGEEITWTVIAADKGVPAMIMHSRGCSGERQNGGRYHRGWYNRANCNSEDQQVKLHLQVGDHSAKGDSMEEIKERRRQQAQHTNSRTQRGMM